MRRIWLTGLAAGVLLGGAAHATTTRTATPPPPAPAPAAPPAPAPGPPQLSDATYTIETLQTRRISPELGEKLRTLRSLQDVEVALKAANLEFRWSRSDQKLPVAMADQLDRVPPGTVFATRQKDDIVAISVVVSKH